jgi:hypothetical protein
VSNGLPILREPKVQTGRRTMTYMATSLALTAGGLLVCYLLVGVDLEEGKTLNAVLAERVFDGFPGHQALVIATLVSEGALLVVGAQAGFIDGPRVLSNMAVDGWAPRRFSTLSDRFTTRNGIVLMGGAALTALFYTGGDVSALVVMYSINVFLTFSLSMASMLRASWKRTPEGGRRPGRILLFGFGLLLCCTILVVTTIEKFEEGGWLTVVVTSLFVCGSFLVHGHYGRVSARIARLDAGLPDMEPHGAHPVGKPNPDLPTAAVLVGSYGGLGVATVRHVLHEFHGHYRNLLFLTAGVIDSGGFKGEAEMEALNRSVETTAARYVDLGRRLGLPSASRHALGTDTVHELEHLCRAASHQYKDITFFAGQIVFQRERWYHRLLHNDTAFALQKRLQLAGLTLVILPRVVR